MSEEEEGEEIENPPRGTTPFPPSSSGATPKPTQSLLDTVGPMDAATPSVTTPIPIITHTSPEQEMEEGEEVEAEEGEALEGDVDLVDVPAEKEDAKEDALMEVEKEEEVHEREEGEDGEEEVDKMDVS